MNQELCQTFPFTQDQPAVYHIQIRGWLHAGWSEWLNEMQIVPQPDGDTLLTGLVIDQAALHGLLKKLRDLGVLLILVERQEDAGR